MKIIWGLGLAAMFMTTDTRAQETSFLNRGALAVKLTASRQDQSNAVFTTRTRYTANQTTTVQISKSTVITTPVDSTTLLRLLENSLNTNFPSGARLTVTLDGVQNLSIYVADNGGRSIWGPGTNLFISMMAGEKPVHVGQQTTTSILNDAGESFSGTATETFTQTVVLGYDDSGLTTRDGTHTRFQVNCLVTDKVTTNLGKGELHATLKMQGAGYGVIQNRDVILQGTASAAISGKPSGTF